MGTSGSTQGERNEASPALSALAKVIDVFIMVTPLSGQALLANPPLMNYSRVVSARISGIRLSKRGAIKRDAP